MLSKTSEMIRRLRDCGYSSETAEAICRTYLTEDDGDGLLSFVRWSELMTDDRKEYPTDV